MDRSENTATARAAYIAPKLSRIGTLEVMTQSTGTSGKLDANYAAGTPGPDLFS